MFTFKLIKQSTVALVLAVSMVSLADGREEDEGALSLERATAALAQVSVPGTDCRIIAVEGQPVAVSHLQDARLQQTVTRARLASYANGAATRSQGVVLATIVGQLPSGALLGNHHLVFPNGTVRTLNDVIAFTPSADPCVFNSQVQIFVHDGTGDYAGYSGEGVATAAINFCGAPGHATIYARVCR